MTPEAQLATFLAKYTPEIGGLALAARKKMQARLPCAIELVASESVTSFKSISPKQRLRRPK